MWSFTPKITRDLVYEAVPEFTPGCCRVQTMNNVDTNVSDHFQMLPECLNLSVSWNAFKVFCSVGHLWLVVAILTFYCQL